MEVKKPLMNSDEAFQMVRVSPAVGIADPTQQRGYAVWFKLYGFGPLNIVSESWDEEYNKTHGRIACMINIVKQIHALPGVTITNISQPVLPHMDGGLETFNIEFLYNHHGPFSVWEPYDQCHGGVMVPRAQYYIDTVDKIMGFAIG